MLGRFPLDEKLTSIPKPMTVGRYIRIRGKCEMCIPTELVHVRVRDGELGFYVCNQWHPMSEDDSEWIR